MNYNTLRLINFQIYMTRKDLIKIYFDKVFSKPPMRNYPTKKNSL